MSETADGEDRGTDEAITSSQPPSDVTDAFNRFRTDHVQLVNFIHYVTSLATRADEVVKIARRALANVDDPDAPSRKDETPDDGPGVAITTLRRFQQLILQMMLTRAVDNFLAYISELLALIFRHKPETLRSRETIPLDLALQYRTMEELVEHLADRRVHRLSYQGMRDLVEYLDKELNFKLFENASDLETAIRWNEYRNLITHNRSIVNELFLGRVGETRFAVGQFLRLEVDEVFGSLEFFAGQTQRIDKSAVAKFGLPVRSGRELPLPDAAQDLAT
jgi:hypothetical protein